jgi:hypothetical protein
MNKKHTPGPWSVKSDPCHFDTLSSVVAGKDNGKGWTPLMVEIGGLANVDEQEANARLIAAAPDLLSALEDLYAVTPDNEGCVLGAACRVARYAIAKATNKEQV